MIQFLHAELWQKITHLARNSKVRHVAVAYLGTGASELLPMKKGDVLVVNMSLANVKNGQVNPFEVQKYYEKGVKVFNCKNLHSKVYLFDKAAIVCSANISANSYSPTGLIECGVLTDDRTALTNASDFIKTLMVEKVSKAYIDMCKDIYNPPKFSGKKGKQLLSKPELETSAFWVINVHPTTFREDEEIILEKDYTSYQRKLKNRDDYDVGSIKFGARSSFIKNVKSGDIVMQIWNFKTRSKVIEPMRVLGITRGRQINSQGHRNMFLRFEEKIAPSECSWTSLEKFLRKNKISVIKKKTTRQLRDETVKRKLHNFWKEQ